MALATTASLHTEFAGLHILLKAFKARCHSGSGAAVQQTQAGTTAAGLSVGEYLVSQSLPLAIASVRDDRGYSPPEAAEVLVDALKHTDNRGSFYDDSTMLASALEALGHLRLQDTAALKPVVKQLTRFLARENVLPSYHAAVAQAGLRAFVELALASPRRGAGFVTRVATLCCQHSQAHCHPHLRRVAVECLMRMAAALQGLDSAVSFALDALAYETAPMVRVGILEDIQPIVLSALSHTPSPPPPDPTTPAQLAPTSHTAVAASPATHATLVRVHAVFSQQHDVKLRHLAFMLLSQLGALPPTLHRPQEEPEAAGGQEPAASVQTHIQGPAKSGGRQGAQSGPQGMLSAEPSMRDQDEVTGKEVQPPVILNDPGRGALDPPPPANPSAEMLGPRPTDLQGPLQQDQATFKHPLGGSQAAGPSRKRPKSLSPAPAAAQDQGAAPGPAPVTAEELEAIMKGGGQQPKPRRKKQKTEAASAANVGQTLKHPSLSFPLPVTAQQPATAPMAAPASAVNSQQQPPAAAVRDQPAGAGQFAAALGAGQSATALGAGQSATALGAGLSATALRAGQPVRPPDRDSSSAAPARGVATHTGKRQTPEPPADSHAQEVRHQASMQPLQATSGGDRQAQTAAVSRTDMTSAMLPLRAAGRSGQGYPGPQIRAGPSAAAPAGWGQGQGEGQANLAAPQHAAGGYAHPHPTGGVSVRPLAMPAESQGGSMASDSAWGTEEERMQRKLQRQAEKQRMKEMETPEEKAARRQAKREKKEARKSTRADTFSMADSGGGRTVDVSDITS
ncbi:hypothetical protein ABBQ32_004214 [Trebouxia sp. C0010 RCD-2024]